MPSSFFLMVVSIALDCYGVWELEMRRLTDRCFLVVVSSLEVSFRRFFMVSLLLLAAESRCYDSRFSYLSSKF